MATRLVKRVAAMAFVAAGIGGFQLVAAGPASADPLVSILANPVCTKSVTYQGALVPAAANGSVNCGMVRGANSEGVSRLQDTLNDCYRSALEDIEVYPLRIDGDFGGNTEKALKKVQSISGTGADGMYGPLTRKAIRHVDPDYGDPCRRVS
ncbi:peptidoglycan-binding domain-containing protein [Actinoplanes sp. NPDC048796]|uniref:peptidoglycan-binding domain-containing protein n=1 Tax=unclassified Actinoplanes TaxID=2626549 RepID=UPI0033C3100E